MTTISSWTLFAIALSTSVDKSQTTEYVNIYSSCDPSPNSSIHINNGLYYIKPFEDGPVIAAICSNGYTMIDPSLDLNLNNFPSYLTSFDYSRLTTDFIITNLDDTSTFREWWLPSNENTSFRVAPDCKSCESSTANTMENNVVYYTDGSNFCYTIFNDGLYAHPQPQPHLIQLNA